ncbi:MAG: FlgD immunoglobulin-like domain containing protein, partial [Bacteroidota bacterium]
QTGRLYAGIAEGGVYFSTDGGSAWYYAGVTSRFPRVIVLKQSNGFLFSGADSDGVFRSTDRGWEWVQVNSGLGNTDARSLIVASSGDLLLGTRVGIYYSSNDGGNWNQASVVGTDLDVRCITEAMSGMFLAGTAGGRILRSTSDGRDWTDAAGNVTTHAVSSLLGISNRLILLGTLVDGIFSSSDSGRSWYQANEGLTNLSVRTLAFGVNGSVLAGTDSSGVFRTRQPLTSANEDGTPKSMSFSLLQNYPNPFNSATRIGYMLLHRSKLSLKVYNVLGQVVNTLFEGQQEAGYHEASWDGRNSAGVLLSSGVCYYRIEVVSNSGKAHSSIKKAILLK